MRVAALMIIAAIVAASNGHAEGAKPHGGRSAASATTLAENSLPLSETCQRDEVLKFTGRARSIGACRKYTRNGFKDLSRAST